MEDTVWLQHELSVDPAVSPSTGDHAQLDQVVVFANLAGVY